MEKWSMWYTSTSRYARDQYIRDVILVSNMLYSNRVMEKWSSCYIPSRGDHSTYFFVHMLVTKNIEIGSYFGLVASTTFLEKGYLFHVNFRCLGSLFQLSFDIKGKFFGLIVAWFSKRFLEVSKYIFFP